MPARKNEPVVTEQDSLPPVDDESMESAADQHRESAAQEAEDGQTNIVRYLGIVSERRISREDFEQAGVEDQDGVVWTKDTGNVLPIDLFSERALEVLTNTGEFQIVRE